MLIAPLVGAALAEEIGLRSVFVVLLVVITIYWPESVTYWLDNGPKIDPATIKLDLPIPNVNVVPPKF